MTVKVDETRRRRAARARNLPLPARAVARGDRAAAARGRSRSVQGRRALSARRGVQPDRPPGRRARGVRDGGEAAAGQLARAEGHRHRARSPGTTRGGDRRVPTGARGAAPVSDSKRARWSAGRSSSPGSSASRCSFGASISVRSSSGSPKRRVRVTPGAVYYGVMQGDRQVGFASSTIDTDRRRRSPSPTISSPTFRSAARRDARRRARTSRSSRALRMTQFDLSLDARGHADSARRGRVDGDSVLRARDRRRHATRSTRSASRSPDRFSCRRSCRSPLALGERPKVGKHYTLPVLRSGDDDAEGRSRSTCAPNRSFVVNDSSAYDSTTRAGTACCPTRFARGSVAADSAGAASADGSTSRVASSRRRSSGFDAAAPAVRGRIRELAKRHDAASPSPTIATFSRRRRSPRTSGWTKRVDVAARSADAAWISPAST